MRLIHHALMSVLLLALAVGTGNGEEKRFEKKFSVTPGGVLTLETDAGSVKIYRNHGE